MLLKKLFLNLVFPEICVSCRKEGSHLCQDCISTIDIASASAHIPANSSLNGLFCAASYENRVIRQAIHAFKYSPFLKGMALPLFTIIISHLNFANKPSFLVKIWKTAAQDPSDSPTFSFTTQDVLCCPIPLHKRRLKWRGYNQSEELARYLAAFLHIPLENRVLIRKKYTQPQINLEKEARLRNMEEAFDVVHSEEIENKIILLIDDVYTTGSTLENAAKALKQAGANQVWGITVARG
ncbi:MAG: hypothetical protein A2748_03355 [Candidatus Wildermuthbacteria bacterium RIFCSPHIGHO2_01_FULL_45_20]|uniref:Phosphoribosyltransferase domain-containing protein n=1 Tax=Candidatus Wildermuthbacteria bacterium RIFCSPHIGHO2_02_FULL_45_25 TaxID=1802450 RepID=A0A1G2R201_9BACT|nr:MAG: hypothetical protein A2748_03355 [Candidatus Wildermuthbacteria bacterium RIFCSPHIGHO2_01_FULL_45_20]OHA66618.1 MAG: hypothetical protein A3C04_00480 [Candidatus Wildermuthbacteria bacterium RIFCSPHIGHO2_02_FULL_45_25]